MAHKRKNSIPSIQLPKKLSSEIPNQIIPQNDFVFRSHYKWLKSISDKKGFTNYNTDADTYAKLITQVVHETIPLIYRHSTDIFKNGKAQKTPLNHSHLLTNNSLENAKRLAHLVTDTKIDDDLSSWWQLGGIQGVRIIGVYVTSATTFYPLFVDCHHLLSPSEKHNQQDLKNYKYSVQ